MGLAIRYLHLGLPAEQCGVALPESAPRTTRKASCWSFCQAKTGLSGSVGQLGRAGTPITLVDGTSLSRINLFCVVLFSPRQWTAAFLGPKPDVRDLDSLRTLCECSRWLTLPPGFFFLRFRS